MIAGSDLIRGLDEHLNEPLNDNNNDIRTLKGINDIPFLAKEISKYLRFPLLAAAGGYTGKGIADVYGAYKGEASLSDAVHAFQFAAGLFSLSSSMYIKDADKDILKKDPVWREMYDEIKEYVSSLLPQPVPVPIPVR